MYFAIYVKSCNCLSSLENLSLAYKMLDQSDDLDCGRPISYAVKVSYCNLDIIDP